MRGLPDVQKQFKNYVMFACSLLATDLQIKWDLKKKKNLKSGIKVTYVQCQPKFNSSLKIILKGKVWLQINKVNGFYTINEWRLYADINLNNLDSTQSAKLSAFTASAFAPNWQTRASTFSETNLHPIVH